ILMSAVVFAGSAQFAAIAVIAGGGGVLAAVITGALLNLRYLATGIAVAPVLPGNRLARALLGQLVVDESYALGVSAGTRGRPHWWGCGWPGSARSDRRAGDIDLCHAGDRTTDAAPAGGAHRAHRGPGAGADRGSGGDPADRGFWRAPARRESAGGRGGGSPFLPARTPDPVRGRRRRDRGAGAR